MAYVYIYELMCVCVCVCACMCVSVRVSIYIYIYMCVCVCVCDCMPVVDGSEKLHAANEAVNPSKFFMMSKSFRCNSLSKMDSVGNGYIN